MHCQQEIRFFHFFLNHTIQSSSHSSEIVCIIHHFVLECQSNGRCLSCVSYSWNSRGCAALLMTRGFKFSLVALQHQKTLNLSMDSFTSLHFFPFLNRALSWHMSVRCLCLICVKLIWWWVFICYLVQFCCPVISCFYFYSFWLTSKE